MTKSILNILILIILTSSCAPLKRLKTVTQGKVEQKNYYEEIPFYYNNNTIILEVIIDEQAYNFMFDTGNDLTSIDHNLIPIINIKSNNVSNDITDAKNIKSNNDYISINSIQIGDIQFSNIGAQVFDHSPLEQVFGCELKLSGIIGSNLMRKAIWQIDYENKVIRLSDRVSSFDVSNNFEFKTNSGRYGGAKIEITLNDFSADYTFDTGSSSFISTNYYLVTLDWQQEKFYLKSIREIETNELIRYQYTFAPNYVTNRVSFFNQWEDNKLINPIKLNSKIVSINGIELDNLTNEQLCAIWKNQKDNILTENVEIEILENGVKKIIELKKKQLLPK